MAAIKIENFDFKDKKTLVRVDFNVPLNAENSITDDTRMKAALPTLRKICETGGMPILMSHLGRPKGKDERFSLQHLAHHLAALSGRKVHFADDCIGDVAKNTIAQADFGDIVLLNNVRFYSEEKKGDQAFAKQLAELGDVYVNDAFGTAHRAHASTTQIADFFEQKMFGFLLQNEIISLDKALKSEDKPFTAIIGGAKVSDKVLVIDQMLSRADQVIIGGAMAYTFIAAQGGATGKSLVETEKLELAKSLIEKAAKNGVKLLLPVDSKIAVDFANDAEAENKPSHEIPAEWMGLDIGEQAIESYKKAIAESKVVIWNGPMGVFEFENFAHGTKAVAMACAEATEDHQAFTLIGGGDSVAAINKFDLGDRVSYVSTGGGAMLEYLEGKTLPGIQAILS